MFKKFSEFPPIFELSNTVEKIRNSILKNQNWNQEDIKNYNDFISGLKFIKSIIVRNISDIIINRYINIFITFEVKHIGRLIIKQISRML